MAEESDQDRPQCTEEVPVWWLQEASKPWDPPPKCVPNRQERPTPERNRSPLKNVEMRLQWSPLHSVLPELRRIPRRSPPLQLRPSLPLNLHRPRRERPRLLLVMRLQEPNASNDRPQRDQHGGPGLEILYEEIEQYAGRGRGEKGEGSARLGC